MNKNYFLILLIGFALISCQNKTQHENNQKTNDIAVYAEHSKSKKPLQAGWNTRVFNKVENQIGSQISLDTISGIITLEKGTYHITGNSAVTYNDSIPDLSSGNAGQPTKPVPNAGYARLIDINKKAGKNDDAFVVGTLSNANMLPSFIDTYLVVKDKTEIILEHQAGFDSHEGMNLPPKEHSDEDSDSTKSIVDGIYLQDNVLNSPWHVFARIAIRRL